MKARLISVANSSTVQAVALGLQAVCYAVGVLWAAEWLTR